MTTTPAVAIAARLALVAASLAGVTSGAAAQATPDQKSAFEFLVPSGTLVPTGAQRGAIKRGDLTALQLSYLVNGNVAITTTVGWARSRDITTAGSPKLDVFTYDLGAELRANTVGSAVTFMPFVGAGAGDRSYNYRSLDVNATHNLAGYASLGGQLGYKRVGLRIEARDYTTGFKPLAVAGTSVRRNDVAVLVGLSYKR
jgi:hypothetical protein